MSSIFDALKKLEDEKSAQKSANAGGDLFQPPQGGGGRFRGIAKLVVILVILAGGAYYLLGGEDEGEAPGEGAPPPAADRLAVTDPVQTPLATPKPPAAPAPPVPAEQPAAAPALSPSRPIMNEEQMRARENLLKRLADLRVNQGAQGADASVPEKAPVVAASPTSPPSRAALVEAARTRAEAPAGKPETATAPSIPVPQAPLAPLKPLKNDKAAVPPTTPVPLPVKPVPEQAVPSPEPIQVARAQPPEVPEEEVTEVSGSEAAVTEGKEAITPERPFLVKSQFPMLMVTEVTYHRRPKQRSARIRLGSSEPRLVREGDRYQGLEVKEIMAGAVTLELAGSDVVVDVGESLSFTVNEPDFH